MFTRKCFKQIKFVLIVTFTIFATGPLQEPLHSQVREPLLTSLSDKAIHSKANQNHKNSKVDRESKLESGVKISSASNVDSGVKSAIAPPVLPTPVCNGDCQSCNECSNPSACFAPDFFYQPSRRLFRDKYTRIQECQSQMIMRPGDEFWWVSSRHLPLKSCGFELCIYRFENCQSQKSSLAELKAAHATNPSLYNVIYIHENRADLNKSEMRFWQNYNILINEAPNAPPVRYIFFSWPADKMLGQIRDVKTKAEVCDYHSYYLASFLCQIKDFNKLSLSGYSYGCRLGLDALHIAGGGTKKCQALPTEMLITKPTFRAAFVATAMQNRCDDEGGLCRFTYQTLDHITLLNNSNDQVLKHFSLLSENGADAIGKSGVCTKSLLPDGGARITQIDARCIARRSHKLEDYYKSEHLRQRIRDTIFWRNLDNANCE